MQLQRIELKKLGTTERILRSDTQGNFDKLENAVNSNAGTTEAWYKQLDDKITTEGQTRSQADQALEEKISQSEERLTKRIAALEDDNSALNRRVDKLGERIVALEDDNSALNRRVDKLGERIVALEDMLFGQHPQEVKMAENSTPSVNSGAMLINLTSKEDK